VNTGSHPAAWRRIEQARPLVAWASAQLAAIAGVLHAAEVAWREGWGLPPTPSPATCLPATDQDLDACWQFAGGGDAQAAWITSPVGLRDELARALWGSAASIGPIAARMVEACRADLPARLCTLLQIEAAAGVAPKLAQPAGAWSGLVCASFDSRVRLLLDAPLVLGVLRSRAPELAPRAGSAGTRTALMPVTTAVAAMRLPLRARLADCELNLASLQDLRVGDVVPLPHRLDAPLLVRDARDEIVFGAYLARRGGSKALELAPAAAVGAQPHEKVEP
jgi:hypothetical protein